MCWLPLTNSEFGPRIQYKEHCFVTVLYFILLFRPSIKIVTVFCGLFFNVQRSLIACTSFLLGSESWDRKKYEWPLLECSCWGRGVIYKHATHLPLLPLSAGVSAQMKWKRNKVKLLALSNTHSKSMSPYRPARRRHNNS